MEELSYAELQAITKYCLSYESQWNSDESAALANWISSNPIPSALREVAIAELLKTDLELGIRGGTSCRSKPVSSLAIERSEQLATDFGVLLPGTITRDLLRREFRLRQEFGDRPRLPRFLSECDGLVSADELYKVIHRVMPVVVSVFRRQSDRSLTTPLDTKLQIGRQKQAEAPPFHRKGERLVVAWESEVTISRNCFSLARYSITETMISNHGVAGGINVNRDYVIPCDETRILRDIELVEFGAFTIRLTH